MKISVFATCLSLLIGSTSGCTAFRKLIGFEPQKPKVEMTSIRVKRVTFKELDLEVGLSIENPNDFSMKFGAIQYRALETGKVVAEGEYTGATTLVPQEPVLLTIPLVVNTEAALGMMAKYAREPKNVMITLESSVVFKTAFGDFEWDFTDKKSLAK